MLPKKPNAEFEESLIEEDDWEDEEDGCESEEDEVEEDVDDDFDALRP